MGSQFESHASECELFAVVFALQQFSRYFRIGRFNVFTDHRALLWLYSMAETSGKFARWLSLIGSVDFGVYHRPGSEIGQADALSRMWQVEMKKGVI